jgi:ABC-type multidrug transport system permease subunit
LQPTAHILPLSVIASSIRDIANDGATLINFDLNFLGIILWMLISFFIATKFFDWQKVNS